MKGKYHPECLLGGLSLMETKQLSYQEIETICAPVDYLYNSKAFYSKKGKMLAVIFAYNQYAVLSLSFNVSYTSCSLVKINLCTLWQQKSQKVAKNAILEGMTVGSNK